VWPESQEWQYAVVLRASPNGNGLFLAAGEMSLQSDSSDGESVPDMQKRGLERNAYHVE
jgi:hypothetical protein